MSKQVRALIEQGLSGEEAAIILMHHYWERDNGRESFISTDDESAIRNYLFSDASDYDLSRFNAWMETYRVIYLTLSECKAATSEICLEISDVTLTMIEQTDDDNQLDATNALLELGLSDLMSAKQVITLLGDATGVPFIEWFDSRFIPQIERYIRRFEERFGAFETSLEAIDAKQETIVYFEERFALNLGVDWKTYAAKLIQEKAAGEGDWNKITSVILGKNDSENLEMVHA